MGRLMCYAAGCMAFVVAGRLAFTGPKWTGTPENFGHATAVAIVAAIGVFCLLIPKLFSAFITRSQGGSPEEVASRNEQSTTGGAKPTPATVLTLWLCVPLAFVPAIYLSQSITDSFNGRQPIENATLAANVDHTKLPTRWVTVTPDKVFDPNISVIRKRKYVNPAKHKFVLLQVADKFLIAEYSEEFGPNYYGRLDAPPTDLAWSEGSAAERQLRAKYPKVTEHILPYILDCRPDADLRNDGYYILGYCAAGALVIAASAAIATYMILARGPKTDGAEALALPSPTINLGQLVSVHRWRGMGMFGAVMILSSLGLCALTAFLGWFTYRGIEATKLKGEVPPSDMWVFPAIAAVMAVTCGIAAYFASRRQPTVALYTGGLGIDHPGAPVHFRWDDVAEYRQPRNLREARWTIDLNDGRTAHFSGRINDFDRFQRGFDMEFCVPTMIQNRLARIAAGETVRIGDFELSRDTIKLGNKSVAWADVQSAVIINYPRRGERFLRVEVGGRLFTWQSANLFNMKSHQVFSEVVGRVAPPRVWPRV